MPRLLYLSHSPTYPDAVGGSELSVHYLLATLTRRGWDIESVCQSANALRGHDYVPPDYDLGYASYRVPGDEIFERISERLRLMRPDAALANVFSMSLHLLQHCLDLGVPGFYYATIPEKLRNKYGPRFRIPSGIHCLANSEVTAADLRAVNVDRVEIVRPMVDFERCRVRSAHERHCITFINPEPVKGVAVALQIAAAMPDREFLFVIGRWAGYTSTKVAATPRGYLAGFDRLSNVTVLDTQFDMRDVYGRTGVLLFPSQWEESFGRVILEAHVNAIPVVASKVGGVPFLLGAGGILVDPRDDVEAYVEALRSLESGETYAQYARAALRNATRPELQADVQVQRFSEYVSSVLGLPSTGARHESSDGRKLSSA